ETTLNGEMQKTPHIFQSDSDLPAGHMEAVGLPMPPVIP
ncbi:hypothetical protein A2U01_0061693, partial [Trifolium medium]|nr:hypothetical protein [Trifolium medium]